MLQMAGGSLLGACEIPSGTINPSEGHENRCIWSLG